MKRRPSRPGAPKRRGSTHEIPVEDANDQEIAEPEASPPEPEAQADEGERTLDHLQRLQAEFSNYRKRVERERLETAAWAQGTLVERLLPVLDDLARATEAIEKDDSPAAHGLLLIRDKLGGILQEAGLDRIEAVGVVFDPSLHEALMTEPVGGERVGTVVEELVPGFRFKGRLIRPARVKVGVEASEG